MITAVGFDLCTDGSFDPVTGEWTFETTDFEAYPPGTYTMEITGSVGAEPNAYKASFTFDVTFVWPCFDA